MVSHTGHSPGPAHLEKMLCARLTGVVPVVDAPPATDYGWASTKGPDGKTVMAAVASAKAVAKNK